MTGRGRNPCLICESIVGGPKGGTVCDVCRFKVSNYDAVMGRLNAGAVCVGVRYWPYIPGRGPANAFLEQLFKELYETLPQPKHIPGQSWRKIEGECADREHDIKPRASYPHSDSNGPRLFNVPAGLGQFFVDIGPAICNALNEAEASGKKQGTNILSQLASGALSEDAFLKQSGIKS